MQDYKETALELAQHAGVIIKKNFSLSMQKEWKANGTPVTETDYAINKLVIEVINERFPKHNILAEEESSLHNSGEYTWVCDPIDGTIPFSHGIPVCVFSLALVHNGEPVLGVILDPLMDRLFFAEQGKGAFLNDKPLQVSSQPDIKNSIIALTGSSFIHYGELYNAIRKEGVRSVNFYSATYQGALVANGEFTASILGSKAAYDTAALKVIVEEAGGKVTDLLGNPQKYDREINGHICSNGLVHEQIVNLVKENASGFITQS